MSLKVHPEVLEKDIDFKEKSEDAEYEFNKITKIDLHKMHENYINSIATPGEKKESKGKRVYKSNFRNKKKKVIDNYCE